MLTVTVDAALADPTSYIQVNSELSLADYVIFSLFIIILFFSY